MARNGKLLSYALIAVISAAIPASVFLGSLVLLVSSDSYLLSLAASTATPSGYEGPVEFGSVTAADVSAAVLAYVKGESRLEHPEFFRQEEIWHLAEVRLLVSRAFLAFYLAIASAVASFFAIFALSGDFRKFVGAVKLSLLVSGAVTLFLVGLAVALWFRFDSSFVAFHKILFTDSLWEFPSNHVLVSLFTEEFFARLASVMIFGSFLGGIFLLAVGRALPGGRNGQK